MRKRGLRFPGSGIRWLGVALAVVGALYLARHLLQRSQKIIYPPNAFHQVQREDMLVSIMEDGALRALNETVIRSGLEGLNRIIHLAPEGAQVKKGDLLVELDSSGLKDRLNEQELLYQDRLFQMLQATASLRIQKSLAESQIKEAELLVENAQSDLEKYRDGDAPLLIRTVEARSGVLAEQVRIATERYARTQELFKTGNASRSELEADALSLKREQLGLSQYQEDLRLIKKFDQPKQVRLLESKVAQAKEELERLKHRTSNEVAQAEADLRTSQRSVDVLEESLKTQKQRLENAKIYAPQDGLVVYASVSPFQMMGGDDRRREEGRFRGNRGGGGPGSGRGDGTGEFRGGGRRGGRFNSEKDPSGSSSSSSSTAETISAGHQRIASAISGTSATQPNATASGGGGNSSGGSRGNEGGAGAGGGQSSGSANASSGFVSYPSMRPSSSFGASNSTPASAGAGGSAANASSSFSSSNSQASITPQFGFRSSSQNASYFSGYESYGAPTILEEGMMVRQRQELIRLPDASKMMAEIKIHESRVSQVRPGMTAYVRIDSIPDRRFKGTVRRVAPLPDAQMSWMSSNLKVFPTDVLIEEELPMLRPGVSARAEVIITNLSKILTVPIQTVTRFRGENVCFVKKGAGIAPVPVTTGWFNDQFVEITSGLREGHHVLLAPVGDEAMEESGETNEVDSATAQPARPGPAREDAPADERRMQRRNSDATDGDTTPERRRNRSGSAGSPTNGQEPRP